MGNNRINPVIFKAYDMRGIYPEEINERVAEILGRALLEFLSGKRNKKLNIVLGRDNRASSPFLFSGLKRGLTLAGSNIIDIGLSPTPMFYFGVSKYKYDGGVQITASHNPPRYNGFKIVKKGGRIVGENSGLKKIKEICLRISGEKKVAPGLKRGKITKKNILKEYLNFNLKGVNLKEIKSLKVVADTGNAVSGILIKEFKKRLPCRIYHLFSKLDSSFPNRGLNPLEEESLSKLKEAVLEKKADLGIAFDGDGDRVVFVDEKGNVILSDLITSLMAKILLRENKGEKIVYNICSSNSIAETIKENGGKPFFARIGHTFIREEMEKRNALFAGETSGHFFLRSHNFSEAPLAVFLEVLKEISKTGKKISALLAPFKKYFYSGQINLKVKDKIKALDLLKKKYRGGKILLLDGVRIDFNDWWFNVRSSNTEDILRLVVEAKTKDLMLSKTEEIIKIIKDNNIG